MGEVVEKETEVQYEERFQRMFFFAERIAALLNVENLSDVNKNLLNGIMQEHVAKFQYNL